MPFVADTTQVILDIAAIRAIYLHKIDGHMLPGYPPLQEGNVSVSAGNIARKQRLRVGVTVLRRLAVDI